MTETLNNIEPLVLYKPTQVLEEVLYMVSIAGVFSSKICTYYLHLLTTIEINFMVGKPSKFKQLTKYRERYGFNT
jgi:subtilase family serine protease